MIVQSIIIGCDVPGCESCEIIERPIAVGAHLYEVGMPALWHTFASLIVCPLHQKYVVNAPHNGEATIQFDGGEEMALSDLWRVN